MKFVHRWNLPFLPAGRAARSKPSAPAPACAHADIRPSPATMALFRRAHTPTSGRRRRLWHYFGRAVGFPGGSMVMGQFFVIVCLSPLGFLCKPLSAMQGYLWRIFVVPPPKLEDRQEKHLCHRHDNNVSVSSLIKSSKQVSRLLIITYRHAQTLVDFYPCRRQDSTRRHTQALVDFHPCRRLGGTSGFSSM